ncbi:putative antirestriction adenine methyltransferase [Barnesiella intestinihominis]|jgi:hypothetical protein|uniref:putative antirestriction adenine methyltransferase n=1 Tax=Barnesiella intestinihominis TaxID=487174 RepID=UPI003FEF5594
MFTGTTPPEVKLLLQDLMRGVKGKDVFIGCSGNYTTDKIMSAMGYTVHSNDVSLYSKLIADLLLDTSTEVECINPELKNVFDTWEETKYKKLVQVMFALKVAQFHQRKNDYQEEMFNAFIEQSKIYYDNTIKKLEKGALDFSIQSFYYGDFLDFLKMKRGKGVGISFPPTYKGGYEKLFSYVEESFKYEHAPYNIFDPKEGGAVFKELLDNDENIIYSDRYFNILEGYLVGKIRLGSNKNPLFAYSSLQTNNHYYIERDKCVKLSHIHILPVDYQFTTDTVITVRPCAVNDVNYYKAFYMANKVNYTTGGDFGLVFMADGMAFGFTSFSKQLSTLSQIFMQSDFVVNSETQRLSKLLIMLVKSHDVRRLIARKMYNYYDGVKTTVYTTSPVSMKYRGVFNLERRDEGKLIYSSIFTEKSLNELYALWIRKYKK